MENTTQTETTIFSSARRHGDRNRGTPCPASQPSFFAPSTLGAAFSNCQVRTRLLRPNTFYSRANSEPVFTLLRRLDTLRGMGFNSLEIRLARRDEGRAALALLLAECAPADRTALVEGMLAELPESAGSLGGLYIGHDGHVATGVGLGQIHRGRTGSVWRPRFAALENHQLGVSLTQLPANWLAQQELRLLQSLVDPHDAAAADWLRQSGFAHVARLAYLVWSDGPPPAPPVEKTPLQFAVSHREMADQFVRVIEQSYIGTLDCPALNGVRTTQEVLEGYREIGMHWPAAWLLAWRDGQPVGCLILADHPAANQCELVYMGLVPEARGQGLSPAIVRQAQELALQRGRPRLVLAVDLENQPALKLYDRNGFVLWDERDVFVRILERADGLADAPVRAATSPNLP